MSASPSGPGRSLMAREYRPEEWVEVRSKEEILATLDKNGRLDELQFMPEMFAYCGKRMRVFKRAHKTCDTVTQTGGRKMESTVHLDDVRCDGSAHGGCQAACLIFWKEAWLKPVGAPDLAAAAGAAAVAPSSSSPTSGNGNGNGHATVVAGAGCTEKDVFADTRKADDGGEPVYACQATRLLDATKPLPWWDLRQYVEDYRSGNTGLGEIVRGAIYSTVFHLISSGKYLEKVMKIDVRGKLVKVYDIVQKVLGGVPYPRKFGTIPAGQKTPLVVLNLQPGELVRIKPYQEILATLDDNNKNRGMYFDAEHVPFCGSIYRVRQKVDRIIHERTGKMINFKNSSVILDGVWCRAHYSDNRMFCPRAIYPYWREAWLERVDPPPAGVAVGSTAGVDASKPPAPPAPPPGA